MHNKSSQISCIVNTGYEASHNPATSMLRPTGIAGMQGSLQREPGTADVKHLSEVAVKQPTCAFAISALRSLKAWSMVLHGRWGEYTADGDIGITQSEGRWWPHGHQQGIES